jgi:hypothetical protein
MGFPSGKRDGRVPLYVDSTRVLLGPLEGGTRRQAGQRQAQSAVYPWAMAPNQPVHAGARCRWRHVGDLQIAFRSCHV